jgi:enolase-phosphatase E1
MKGVLTDIEGTTSPISFVRDVMFPYARARLSAFLQREEASLADLFDEVRRLADAPDADLRRVERILTGWMDEDRKAAPLKEIQGRIWASGFADGALVAPLYDDVLPAFDRWSARSIPLYVYSSGSVEAQRLFFGHTSAGDLRGRFSGWFDTRVGSKLEPESYRAIVDRAGHDLVFLSDHRGEIDAARRAGLDAVWIVRQGPLPAAPDCPTASSFDGIDP